MPFPNFHSVRITPANSDGKGHQFTGYAYKTLTKQGNKQIDAVIGFYNGGSAIQAYRFPKDKWTLDEVKAWVKNYEKDNPKIISITPAGTSEKASSFVPIDGVEIIRAGTTNDGRQFDENTLFEAALGTNIAIEDGLNPKVKIGDNHYDAKIEGIINFAYVRDGSLYVDMQVPESLKTEFENNPLLQDRSMELAHGVILKDGTKLPSVVTGVVFGVDVPASHGLSAFGSLEFAIESFEHFASNIPPVDNNGKNKETKMTPEELAAAMKTALQPLLDSVAALTAKIEAIGKQETSEPPAPANAAMESELKAVKDAFAAEKAKVEKFESDKKTAFVEGLVTAGKVKIDEKAKVTETFESLLKGGMTFEKATESMTTLLGAPANYHTGESVPGGKVEVFNSNISSKFSTIPDTYEEAKK